MDPSDSVNRRIIDFPGRNLRPVDSPRRPILDGSDEPLRPLDRELLGVWQQVGAEDDEPLTVVAMRPDYRIRIDPWFRT